MNQDVLDALIKLRTDGPRDPALGICGNMGTGLGLMDLKHLFIQWPKFTGSIVYPIPGVNGASPHDTYQYTYAFDMWNPNHPYGALRLELLDWLIQELSKELSQ